MSKLPAGLVSKKPAGLVSKLPAGLGLVSKSQAVLVSKLPAGPVCLSRWPWRWSVLSKLPFLDENAQMFTFC